MLEVGGEEKGRYSLSDLTEGRTHEQDTFRPKDLIMCETISNTNFKHFDCMKVHSRGNGNCFFPFF